MSISSSPPLDLDPAEDLTAEDVILHSTEFTKVQNKFNSMSLAVIWLSRPSLS